MVSILIANALFFLIIFFIFFWQELKKLFLVYFVNILSSILLWLNLEKPLKQL